MRLAVALISLVLAGPVQAQSIIARSDDGRVFALANDGTWTQMVGEGERVRLRLQSVDPSFDAACRLTFAIENRTQQTFVDYAPNLLFIAEGERVVGRALVGLATNDLRPNGVAFINGWTDANVGCEKISEIWVSGFSYACARDSSACLDLLQVVPEGRIPISIR